MTLENSSRPLKIRKTDELFTRDENFSVMVYPNSTILISIPACFVAILKQDGYHVTNTENSTFKFIISVPEQV